MNDKQQLLATMQAPLQNFVDLLEARHQQVLAYLRGLTPWQQIQFQRLQTETPTDVRTNLVCGDCGALLVLRLGRFGRFYGCTQYEVTGCKGSVSANDDGSPKGWPANAETRKMRHKLAERFKTISLHEKHPSDNDLPRGQRFRWRTTCEVLGKDPKHGFNIGELDKAACERALEALDILDKPKKTRWDHMRLDFLLPD